MNRLEDSVKELREVEKLQAELLEGIRTLKELIEEEERKMEQNERIADSYRTIIAHESKGSDVFLSDILKEPSIDSYSEALRAIKPSKPWKKTASSLLKPDFIGARQNDIVKRILRAEPTMRLTTDKIVERAYDFENEEELKKAKSTMASVLSRGVTKGLWQGGSGIYYLSEESDNEN
jgi:tRNA/tmRNA/rRNA uracil-C5-methylase (TrmA/RlmC/RlmD family)